MGYIYTETEEPIMGKEFELKFRASANQMAAILADYDGFQEITMQTTYYDTPDTGLTQRKWTLRHRLENGASVCTLKTPGKNGERGEWETECEDILSAIPLLCKLGAPSDLPLLTADGVVQVCGARFTRHAALLRQDHCSLELALDQGVLLGGGKEISFHEVEVELKEGSRDCAIVFASGLAEKYSLIPESTSKFKRAMALCAEK